MTTYPRDGNETGSEFRLLHGGPQEIAGRERGQFAWAGWAREKGANWRGGVAWNDEPRARAPSGYM